MNVSPSVSASTASVAASVAPAAEGGGMATQALRSVALRVQQAAQRAGRNPNQVTLVAVSKTKPVELLREVYNAGHRHFGENYVQEVIDKAPQMPEDVRWHFIGHLQSNKAKALVSDVPNLYMVETVDSQKIATYLDKAVGNQGRSPLKVLVQVNTSGEESKFGVEPADCLPLVRHVRSECPHLEFAGLMTIGMADYTSTAANFSTLAKCREEVCAALGLEAESLALSMGMSGDFEQAIEMGSTNVRVGTTIFGARDYTKK
eukprot:TRINITY_DN10196_c0_g2_i1.p1 TRINITY_DN10196_c0_g2~~TRINITY_DN10196_c0_g2_i1.p1  ORF type:complete len:261 (+),score=52.35 TRINITY_DN10196_c0_g2_i1:922-1704(+)